MLWGEKQFLQVPGAETSSYLVPANVVLSGVDSRKGEDRDKKVPEASHPV